MNTQSFYFACLLFALTMSHGHVMSAKPEKPATGNDVKYAILLNFKGSPKMVGEGSVKHQDFENFFSLAELGAGERVFPAKNAIVYGVVVFFKLDETGPFTLTLYRQPFKIGSDKFTFILMGRLNKYGAPLRYANNSYNEKTPVMLINKFQRDMKRGWEAYIRE